MDSLCYVIQKMGGPPFFNRAVMQQLGEAPLLSSKITFPIPSFTRIHADSHGNKTPQAIAHRGYKAKYPENTMKAFKGAVEVGVHALETDVHLSKDGVVVLSHDATLQRCFGVDKKLIDCDWKVLQEQRTIKEPHEPMPRLEDLIRYLAQPEASHVWLLLDIKIDNKADDIMRLMSEEIARIPPLQDKPWENRIILGCWAAKFIPLCHQYFPGFPITNIGFSIPYARQFFAVRNISFNMLQAPLVSPSGQRFLRDARARGRAVYTWTVNEEKSMDWCIRQGLDGVITDEPKKYLEVCKAYDPTTQPPAWSWKTLINFVRINIFAWLFGLLFFRKYGFALDKRFLDDNTKK